MTNVKVIFIACLTLFLIHFNVTAVEVERFEQLKTPNGSTQGAVTSSFCDSRGFLWYGTRNGLNRYDGYNFHSYMKKQNDIYSLSSNRILKIWEDFNGFIWVETHEGHYHYLDITTDRFYSFPKSTEINNNKNVRITSFLEVRKGEIWLGTDNSGVYHLTLNDRGIYEVQHFGVRNINPISNEKISFIIADDEYTVWIGTANGVNRVVAPKQADEEFIFQHFLIDHSFISAVSLKGKVWFGTKNKGLISFNNSTLEFINEENISDSIQISILQKSQSGDLLIGTTNAGLKIINPDINQVFSFFKNQSIKGIYQGRQGILWLESDRSGISRFNPNSSVEQHFEMVPKEKSLLFPEERPIFFEDKEGNMWIGTHGGGLAFYDSDKSKFQFFRNNPDNEYSLSSDVVNAITQDKSGLIWVGAGQTVGGLNKIIPANPLFKHIRIKENADNQSDNLIRSILQDNNNNIWVGTKSGLICVYNQDFELIHTFDHRLSTKANIPESNIYSLMQDNEGFIWIGSKGSGVAVSQLPLKDYNNYSDVTFVSYENDPNDGSTLNNNFVYSIIQDYKGVIWIGTHGGGINLVQNRTASKLTCVNYTTENSNLSNNNIRHLYEDKKQRIWIATTYGLNLWEQSSIKDSTHFISFTYESNKENSLIYNDVVHIFEDTKNRLWFGTYGGVSYFTDANDLQSGFNSLTNADGLINDVVFGITEDKQGNLWFSTQNGISRYDVENKKFDNYDNDNGLYFSNFCENSCVLLQTGQLAFGNTSGLLIITPDEEKREFFSPPICFTNFLLFNKEVDINEKNSPLQKNINYTDEIILKHNQSSFSIEFAALSFFDPEKTSFIYMFENFDDIWYNVKNERKATYTNVPPGEYTFKVKASNWDGTWTENPRELKIKILRPWWGTHIAYFGYFILLILLFEFLRRSYMNYHHLQTDLKVEKRVNEIKLQFFTNISHEIRTPLTLILGPLEDLKKKTNLPDSMKTPINIMNRNGKRILRLVNQLLDFRKIQNQKMTLKIQKVEMCSFVQEICMNFEQLANQKNIHFTFPEVCEEKYAWIDKEKIDSVLFNVLSNAFKFTKNDKSIDLVINEVPGFISIEVKDEGKGIPKDKLTEIFTRFNTLSSDDIDFSGTGIGLAYSYELIKLQNGDIQVDSTPGKGSTFTVLISTGKNHFDREKTIFIEEKPEQKYSHVNEYNLEDFPGIVNINEEEIQKQYKVVIVEDNTEVIQYVESILNQFFYTYHAFNGKEGIKLIHDIHPDLIITDVMMPEMDGITMTKSLKDDFSVSHIPVIMLTAKSAIDDQIQGIETGAEAYVLKPFNSEYLVTVVNNLLKQRRIVIKKYSDMPFTGELKITNRDEEFIKNTIHIIEENCQDTDFNVNELINKSNLGRTVFFNKIKGLTGFSPVEFMRKIKLHLAAKQLEENNCGVAEAAYLCGFNSVKYFTKRFKSEFGVNPSEYRNQQPKFYNN